MFDKLKQEALRQGMRLVSNPKVMKLMADPRLMNAISQGYALKSQLQSQAENAFHTVAKALNLATREDVETLRQALTNIEDSVSQLEQETKSKPT